jgi:hypothetical protein
VILTTNYKYPHIPTLCECGCGETIFHKRRKFIFKHVSKKGRIPWNKGIETPTKTKIKQSKSHQGIPKSVEWIQKYTIKENNPNWRGGITHLPYCEKWTKELREAVRIRDNYTCQLCGTIQHNRNHCVHHIHYDKSNCYPDLITLCIKCNPKVNYQREMYETFFMNKLNERHLLFWTKCLIGAV